MVRFPFVSLKLINGRCGLIANLAERISEYTRLYERILDLDPKIRFTGVINDKGRLVAGGMRPGVKSLELAKDDEVLYMELALRVRMRHEFDEQLGDVRFALSSRTHAIVMSFPINDDILYVTAEPDANFCTLPKKILEILA